MITTSSGLRRAMATLCASAGLVALTANGSVDSSAAAPPTGASSAASRCSSGAALFPLPVLERHPAKSDFAQLTANRGRLWAGVAYDEYTNAVEPISWTTGSRRAHVLDRFRYLDTPYDPQSAVSIAGITPRGDVVAAIEVQGPSHADGLVDVPVHGAYWHHGVRHTLSHAHRWVSWVPIAVSDAGRVVGWATTGHGSATRIDVVEWATPSSHYTVIARAGKPASVAADGAGDVAWTQPDDYAVLRSPDGSTRELDAPRGGHGASRYIYPMLGSRRTIVGETSFGQIVQWNSMTTGSSPIVASPVTADGHAAGFPDAIGPAGDLVTGYPRARWLLPARGGRIRIPKKYVVDGDDTRQTVTASGALAYTSIHDHLVHLFTCR